MSSHGHVVVGFDREPHPVPVGQLAEMPGVVLARAARRPSAAGPRGTARRSPGCRPRGRSSPAGTAADRSRAAAGTPRGSAGVQFCEPTSQLSMCVGDQRLAGQRPDVGDELAHQAGEVRLGRLLAQLVALQPAAVEPARVRCPCRSACGRSRRTVHLPARHVPRQPAVVGQLAPSGPRCGRAG